MINQKKIAVFFLILGLNSTFFCQDSENNKNNPEINKPEEIKKPENNNPETIDPVEKALKDIENVDLKKELEDEKNNSEKQQDEDLLLNKVQDPAKMLERLSEKHRAIILSAIESGRDMLAITQHPTIFLVDIVEKLGNRLEATPVAYLTTLLRKTQDLLASKGFQLFILFGSQNGQVEKDLKDLVEEIEKTLKQLSKEVLKEKEYFIDHLKLLQDGLSAICSGKADVLEKIREKYLKEVSANAWVFIDKAKDELSILKKKLKKDEDKDLLEAVEFWSQALEQFDSLKPSKLLKLVNVGGSIAPFIEGGYFFYRKFMELYKVDNPDCFGKTFWGETISSPVKLACFMGDQAFRMAMIPLHLLRRLSQISKAGVEPQLVNVLSTQLVSECLGIYFDPNFCVKTTIWPFRAFYRIAPAVVYNEVQYNYSPESWKELAKDEKFKRAVWFSLKDGYQTLVRHTENLLVKKIKPETLNKIENGSLGLLKPALLGFILDTAMPLVSYKYLSNPYLKLKKKDVFAKEFGTLSENLSEYLGDWNFVGDKQKALESDAYFVEARICGYLASNLGSYFGKKIAKANSRPIKFITSKLVKGCSVALAKIGIIQNADWQEQLLKDIKEIVKDLLTTDPTMVLLAQQTLFPMLAGFGIMTQLEVAKLEEEFNSSALDEQKIDFIVDRIYSSFTDLFVTAAGGFIGSYVAWMSADYLMKNRGPFWPQIKEEASEIYDNLRYGV